MKTRSIYFWILWYGKRDIIGYLMPSTTVEQAIAELRKYQAEWPCFTVRIDVDSP